MNAKNRTELRSDTVIAGGGIAGLVTAFELLQQGQQVTIVDRDSKDRLGGLARWAFGGMALSGTTQQKSMGIPDNPALMLKDWRQFGELDPNDSWPNAWAEEYAQHNHDKVYRWLVELGFKFLPAVNWVERGLHQTGNSVPRYHILWGTGWGLVEKLIEKLQPYIANQSLNILYQHKVIEVLYETVEAKAGSAKAPRESDDDDKLATGVVVTDEQAPSSELFQVFAKHVVIACGGINGSTHKVRENWQASKLNGAQTMLNGANPISDGELHDRVAELGGHITHADEMWNYAAGIAHPQADFEGHGLSLIPSKTALWVDHTGQRIGPVPLVTGFDTHHLCEEVAKQEKPWTWQIMNWEIAAKEMAVSGSLHNPSIRDHKVPQFLKELLLGNHRLVNQLVDESEDVICADSVEALATKMNKLTGDDYIDTKTVREQIELYDKQLASPEKLQNDDQLRRIHHARQWKPDRLRTCKPKAILGRSSKNGKKLIAIRMRLITRKSLGGVKTNLKSQVLGESDQVINGLYCVGEAAGFGGGGACGKRSLEGTFLSACILTARNAAQAIKEKK